MDPLVTFCLRMGDTTLILGQQTAAWCGHAPVLEEDIAFANMGLDLIGQTQLWYKIAAEAEGKGRTPDDLAFFRTERQFLNAQLVERPDADFAHALMRQYLFDAWHLPMLEALCESGHQAIRELAQKSVKEVRYHIDRSRDLIVRLGDGSGESRAKMQGALDALWPYAADLMATDEVEAALADQGVLPGLDCVKTAFDAETAATMARAKLNLPDNDHARTGGRSGIHTEAMGYLLAEMQSIPRAFPDARW